MNDLLKYRVAYRFPRVESINPVQCTLNDFARALGTDTTDKRDARCAANHDARSEAKRRCPCWYLGGEYNIGDAFNSANIQKLHGLVTFDFDHITQGRVDTIKRRLAACSCVVLAATSVSGNGVFALVHVPVEYQADQEKYLQLLALLRAAILFDACDGETLDEACKDVARRRFESYDPQAYVNYNAEMFEPDILKKANSAFEESAIKSHAVLYKTPGGTSPGADSTGYALAGLAVAAGGRVYGNAFRQGEYPFKFQGVVLGTSGSGKSTSMRALARLCGMLGAREISPESSRKLEEAICLSAANRVPVPDPDSPKKGAKKIVWSDKAFPQPVLMLTDEAGADRSVQKRTDYKAGLDRLRRQLFDDDYMPSTSLQTELCDHRIKNSFTEMRFSTVRSWASSCEGDDRTAGDARRVLEFWALPIGAHLNGQDEKETACMRFMYRGETPREAADTDGLFAMLTWLQSDVQGKSELRIPGLEISDPLRRVQCARYTLDRTGEVETLEDAFTIVANLATAESFARTARVIDEDALMVGWSIFWGVLENREKISPEGAGSRDGLLIAKILDTVKRLEAGTPRKSSIKRAFNNAPDFAVAFERMLATGRLKTLPGSRCKVASDEEYQAVLESAEYDILPQAQKTFGECELDILRRMRSDDRKKSYLDCGREEREERVTAYLARAQDIPIVQGERNVRLFKLRILLERKNSMWDDVAREQFVLLARSLGLDEREIRLLLRPLPADGRSFSKALSEYRSVDSKSACK